MGNWSICSEISVVCDVELCYTDWGAEVSLYNPCSGDTHLLNLFPFEVIQFLLLKPAVLASIAQYMATLCDEENNAQWNDKILNLLKQLKELELIDYQK